MSDPKDARPCPFCGDKKKDADDRSIALDEACVSLYNMRIAADHALKEIDRLTRARGRRLIRELKKRYRDANGA